MCAFFWNFDLLRITLQSLDLILPLLSTFCSFLSLAPHLRHKFRAPSLPLPPLIFSYLQALIYGFLWWWAYSWLIFSLKWPLQSPFLLLHSATIDLQEAKDSIDEEDPRPTSSTWSYINCTPHVHTQIHHQHLYHLISMSLSTSTSSHLNILINTNIISYQH